MLLRRGVLQKVIPQRHAKRTSRWSEAFVSSLIKAPYLFFFRLQIAFPASYCGGARGSTDYLLNPVNPSSHQSGMILTIIVFAAASIRKKQGSEEMRWNETSGRISSKNAHVFFFSCSVCARVCGIAQVRSNPKFMSEETGWVSSLLSVKV